MYMNSERFEFRMKHLRRVCLLIGLILFAPAIVYAEIKNVSGVVVDETGECLIGATVIEKGTNNATITNNEGVFSLKLSSPNPVLEISYIGYEKMTYPVKSSKVKIVMQVSAVSLDAVVVVAYGTQKKVTVTGSIASIGSEDIKKRLMGWELVTPEKGSFTDNQDTAKWYYSAIETAYAHGALTAHCS